MEAGTSGLAVAAVAVDCVVAGRFAGGFCRVSWATARDINRQIVRPLMSIFIGGCYKPAKRSERQQRMIRDRSLEHKYTTGAAFS